MKMYMPTIDCVIGGRSGNITADYIERGDREL